MNNINIRLFALIILCLVLGNLKAQTPYLKIGDHIPDTLAFKNIINYPVKNPKLSDLRGKLLILDFWSTGCGTCIASMPEMERIQNHFGDSIQIVLINSWETTEEIAKRTRNMPNFKPGKLARIDGDKFWRTLFPYFSIPHHVWIDKSGKVIAITNGYNTNIENIAKTLDGQQPKMMIKHDLKVDGYDPRKQGLLPNNHGSLVIPFQSGFVRGNGGFGSGNVFITDTVNNLYKRIWLNTGILQLYRSAYSFYYNGRVSLETNQRELFNLKLLNDDYLMNKLYSYQITLPVKEKENINKYMINDLNDFFAIERGFTGKVEPRKIVSYVATLADLKLLKSKGGKSSYEHRSDTILISNTPFDDAFQNLQEGLEDISKPFVLINEVTFKGNIDMMLTGNLQDFNNIKRQFAQYGISLKKRKRTIDVLVFKDISKD